MLKAGDIISPSYGLYTTHSHLPPEILFSQNNVGTPVTPTTPATRTTTNPYCELYLKDLANRLHVSVATLRQAQLGAHEDVLAQLVREDGDPDLLK